ncbi:MAG: hypothetical protein AMXMBFR57_36480 [Acidimicrobiia bacterium]
MLTVAATVAAVAVVVEGAGQFRTDTNVVAVFATVTDRTGMPVRGLTREDFEIFDEGQARPVTTFVAPPHPVAVTLLLDRSRSVAARSTLVTDAAAAFIDGQSNVASFDLGEFGAIQGPVEVIVEVGPAEGRCRLRPEDVARVR